MEILTFCSCALHKTDQELFWLFIFILPSTSFPKPFGKSCRGKNTNVGTILCLQHITIPKLLSGTWVKQLSRSTRRQDFQHAALTFPVHSHLKTYFSLTARSQSLLSPTFFLHPFHQLFRSAAQADILPSLRHK